MTAVSDFMHPSAPAEPARMVDGRRWLVRGAQRMSGVALILAALGLWLQPGASFDADLALIKLALSLLLGFAGLAILQAGRARAMVQVELDTLRREVRLVRVMGRAKELVSRTKMVDLGGAEVDGNLVRLYDPSGALLADVAMTDPFTRSSLINALRDSGKL